MIKSNGNTFQLVGKEYQYNFYVEDGKLYHAYYGAFLNDYYNNCPQDNGVRYEEPKEYSEFGRGDYKVPSVVIHNGESLSTDFRFDS